MENNYPVLFPSSSSHAAAAFHWPTSNSIDAQLFVSRPSDGFPGLKDEETATVDAVSSRSGRLEGGGASTAEGKKKDRKEKKVKKPRYAFQTRSQVDILDDGYRWRKYGQKAVKNNKFPRSYYRCTHQGCNVKKQVQRLSRDESTVVTTYEGMHTHPIHNPGDSFEDILLNQMRAFSGR